VRTDYIDGELSLSGTYNLSKSMDITLGSKYTRHINRKLDTDRRHSNHEEFIPTFLDIFLAKCREV